LKIKFALWLLIPGLLSAVGAAAQETPTVTPNIPATLTAIPITINSEDYTRDCGNMHTLSFDSDYHALLESPTYHLDADHIIVTDYGTQFQNTGEQYVPQGITSFGLTAAYAWCEFGDVLALQLAINQADWLVNHAEVRNNFVTWQYHFANASFFAPPGWTSGLGNGQAIVLLTQLYLLGGDTRYLETAQQAVNSYRVAVKDGGVRASREDGSIVFEEVAHPDIPPSFILNGHMIAVDSLAYYADALGDATAQQLVDEGIQAVRNHLDDFDASSTTFYSLGPVPWGSSRNHYAHSIHIRGLFWMYRRTGDPTFLQYAFDWQRYKWPPLPADGYRDTLTQAGFIEPLPDLKRVIYESADTQSFILDLYEVQPVRSFSYNMVGPYPADYSVEISQDATTWETIESVTDTTERHATIFISDLPARYVRWSLGDYVRDNPYYSQLSDGVYKDYLMVGVMRADGPAYWEEPILLVTDGEIDDDNTQYLRDGNPETTLALPPDAVLYADLRTAQQVSTVTIQAAPESDTAERRAWVEVSADLQTWMPLIPPEGAVQLTLPGSIDLPAAATPYRYLRLHLEGGAPFTMTEVQVLMATSPPPAP
jgi:hypothetical protein